MSDPFTFGPEERGFERVTDDDSDALYAADESRDATGEVDRVEFAARGNERTGFYAQKVERDAAGHIVGKQTFGTKKDSREDAVESVEKQVRNRTAANFGGFEIGEFNVGDDSNIALARRAHLSRPKEAQASDAAKRAPVTTDASRYASQPGELDYPGVDTPSTDPNVLPKDVRQKQRPETTEPNNRPNQNLAANPTEDIALRDEAEAGLSRSEVKRNVESPADVPVSLDERRDSMVADGMGGVRFNANVGGYRETDRADVEQTPPDIARGEDPFDMSKGGGALDNTGSSFDPDRDEREAIRQLERNSPGREAEQIEKVRLYDDPPEDALATFGKAADRVVRNRDEITDPDRADTTFFKSDTIDTIDRLRSEVR